MGESIIIQLMGIISYDIVGLKGNGANENKRLNFASVVYSLSNVIIEYSLLIFQCSPFILNCNILIAYCWSSSGEKVDCLICTICWKHGWRLVTNPHHDVRKEDRSNELKCSSPYWKCHAASNKYLSQLYLIKMNDQKPFKLLFQIWCINWKLISLLMVTVSLALHGWIFILVKIGTLFLGNHHVRRVVLWLALAIEP